MSLTANHPQASDVWVNQLISTFGAQSVLTGEAVQRAQRWIPG